MEKKKGIIITGITLLLLLVVGVTYAFFTYESGTKSDIVTGQIYMNYEETSTISLTGVFPETKEQALSRNGENGVFEFSITVRNTSKYPVYYEIDLLEGGVMTGKTEQSPKILPEHIRIYLERDGEPLVDGMTYKDWNNRRIYVDTVPANQTSNIEHKYTLRMWIDENVTISDTSPNADYTTTEWNDAYTSLKVRVVGDFEYKEVATDATCFAYNVVADGITYDYVTNITLDTSEEKVEDCMANMLNNGPGQGNDLSTEQDGYKSFCEGTGTYEDPEFGTINLNQFVNSYLRVGMPTDFMMELIPVVNIATETRYYELNTSEESVNACKEYMLNDTGGSDRSDAQDGYQSFCEGTGTFQGETIYDFNGAKYDLIERNVFTQVEEIPQVIEITNYDETCGTDVIIPSTIEGLPVTRIADAVDAVLEMSNNINDLQNSTLENSKLNYSFEFTNDVLVEAFSNRRITSVIFPNTLRYIGTNSFYGNNLKEVMIPDNVTEIGERAFYGNNISKLEIGTGISVIPDYAFSYNTLTELIIPDNITIIGSSAFSGNNLTELIIPDSITEIGSWAFSGNNISKLEIGDGITSIKSYAFVDSPLVTVNIKNNPSLGKHSFRPSYPDYINNFQTFKYGGTCEELNRYGFVFENTNPQQIITSDTNSCTYTGPETAS